MAHGDLRVEWDEGNLQALVNGPIKADNIQRARRVRRTARALAPTGETGALKRSIDILDTTGARGSGWVTRVGSVLDYALWVNNGTGIYGPRHSEIQPRHAAFLQWTEDGRQVRARSVRGQPGRQFMEQAIEAFR